MAKPKSEKKKEPEWTPIESSNLKSIRREGKDGKDLHIEFRTGARYLFPDAGKFYQTLLDSPSPGGFFAGTIRPLPCRKTYPQEGQGAQGHTPKNRG